MSVVMMPPANPMPVVVTPVNVFGQLRVCVGADAAEAGTDNRRIGDIDRTKGDSSERRCRNQALLHRGLLSDKGRVHHV
jgi:hypothetical protein